MRLASHAVLIGRIALGAALGYHPRLGTTAYPIREDERPDDES